jgi:ribosomal protein S18 acetylase RimI-like enzyme
MAIEPMAHQHVDAVARLHCASLRGLLTQLGLPAARAFYSGSIGAQSAIALVYTEQSAVQGFVLGSAHPDQLKREVVRRNPAVTLLAVIWGTIRRPASLVWLVRSSRGPDEGIVDGRVAELTYLAVGSDSRSGGIGRQLVEAFNQALRATGVESYELSVDEDNAAAIGFYERQGFQLIGRYREFGMLHRRYRL